MEFETLNHDSGKRLRFTSRGVLIVATAALAALLAAWTAVLLTPLRFAAAGVATKIISVVAAPLMPDVGRFEQLPGVSEVVASDGTRLALIGEERRRPVPLERIPDHVAEAVLAAEDSAFYRHPGVDPAAMLRAAASTVFGDLQGGSTLTQQLAKINYTGTEQTVIRKLRELLYAIELEDRFSKDRLLQRYLNQVYFGQGAYGIRMAARTFFGTTPENLDVAQAAMLAGKIHNPEGLDPWADPDAVERRRNQVLAQMEDEEFISAERYRTALRRSARETSRPTSSGTRSARRRRWTSSATTPTSGSDGCRARAD